MDKGPEVVMRTICSLSLAATAMIVVAIVSPGPVEACSGAPASYEIADPESPLSAVPLEGVLVFEAVRDGYPDSMGGALERITVRDATGSEVPGAVETVELQREISIGGYGYVREEVILLEVWRADAELTPESEYTAEVSFLMTDSADPTTFTVDFTTAADPYAGLEAPVLEEVSARASWASLGGEHECVEPSDGGSCPDCSFIDGETMARLTASYAPIEDRYAYLRLVADGDRVVERRSRGWTAASRGIPPEVYVADRADEHCVTLELVSLVDGSVASSEMGCAPEPRDDEGDDAGMGGGDAGMGGGAGTGGGGCSATGAAGLPLGCVVGLALVLGLRRRRPKKGL